MAGHLARPSDTPDGLQTLPAKHEQPRHRHARDYVALVIEGQYVEAGDSAHVRATPGMALVHRLHDAHRNRSGVLGARVLNLPLPADAQVATPVLQVRDPDTVARLTARHPDEAVQALLEGASPVACTPTDWPDELAAVLRLPDPTPLADWAGDRGLAPATLSRGFAAVYGTTPARYRAEARARNALALLTASALPLTEVALASGHADHAHLCRAIVALTGTTPSRWRRTSNPFKTC